MSRQLPPLYALSAFEAAARHNSFTRAADDLSITQSAVSRHIRTLETHFGCRLFVRQGRQLQLSEAGRLLLPGIREGFGALERACALLRGEDEVLRLKAPSTVTMRWLLARLSRFRSLSPENDVQLTSAWMDVDRVDFHQEPFDCAVLLGRGDFPPDWEATRLFPEWLVPVGAADLEAPATPDAQWLGGVELLHPTPDRRDWVRWLERTGLSGQVSIRGGQVFDTLELAIVAAARGYGVSIGDLVMVAEDVNEGRLSLPCRTAVSSGDSYWLVWPKYRRGVVRLERLRNFLVSEVEAMTLPAVEIID